MSECEFVKYIIIKRLDMLESTYRIEGVYDDYKECLSDIRHLEKISNNKDYIFEIYCKGSGTQMGE
jgi:uncharacterized protein YutD